MTGLISVQMISEKCYSALVLRLLISLLLLPRTTEMATSILSMAGYHQSLHRRFKQNPHQPMIPYFPYTKSYSPIDLPYGTPSNCWNTTQSLVDKPCGVQPWSVWYHKTWISCWYYQHLVSSPLSLSLITQNYLEYDKRLTRKRWSPIFSPYCRQKTYSWWQGYLNDLQMNQCMTPNSSFWRNLLFHLTPYLLFRLVIS